jgi:hypothetical protein
MKTLSARERRRKAVLNKIARLTLARNKGIKAIVTAETQLPGLERQARRYDLPVKPRQPKPAEHPKVVARETKVADELVEFAAKVATPEALAVATGEPKPEPKRQRKPKAGSRGPKLLEDLINKPFREARRKRMEAMGFRQTKRKGKVTDVTPIPNSEIFGD